MSPTVGDPDSWVDIRSLDENPYRKLWIPRDGQTLGLMGRVTSILLVTYIMMNRVIPDRFVLPVGLSIRLYEVVLILLGVAWVLWMIEEPHPFPTGLVGLFALGTFAIIGLAPVIHSLTLTAFQADATQRGLFRLFTFSTMFLASFHLAFRAKEGLRIVTWVVIATAFQATFAIIEFVTQRPVAILDQFALAIGMIPDPRSIRGGFVDVFSRITGEVRAVSTAPHPIVLSAVIALGVLVVGMWLLYAERGKQRRWLLVAGALLVVGLPVANSRTAYVILGFALLPLAVLHVRRLPQMIVWALPLLFALAISFAISPQTPRLLLNSLTNADQDQNTQIRISRIPRVPELMEDNPFIGAGYLTHDVAIQLFDNAYFVALIEFGIVGFLFFVLFLLAVMVKSWTAAYRAEKHEMILPTVGVIAVLALLAGAATFDAWTFDQFFPTALILMGVGLGRSFVILRREHDAGYADVGIREGVR